MSHKPEGKSPAQHPFCRSHAFEPTPWQVPWMAPSTVQVQVSPFALGVQLASYFFWRHVPWQSHEPSLPAPQVPFTKQPPPFVTQAV